MAAGIASRLGKRNGALLGLAQLHCAEARCQHCRVGVILRLRAAQPLRDHRLRQRRLGLGASLLRKARALQRCASAALRSLRASSRLRRLRTRGNARESGDQKR